MCMKIELGTAKDFNDKQAQDALSILDAKDGENQMPDNIGAFMTEQSFQTKNRGRPKKDSGVKENTTAPNPILELSKKDLAILEKLAKYGFDLSSVIACGLEHITLEFGQIANSNSSNQ